jgi:hypothetical protein
MRPHPEIIERDDGRFALGWQDDAPGPFESRRHAEAVAIAQQRSPERRNHENTSGS